MKLNRSLDRNKKREYIKEFMKQHSIDYDMIAALCSLNKEKFNVNGIYNTILKIQIRALEEMNNGKSTND